MTHQHDRMLRIFKLGFGYVWIVLRQQSGERLYTQDGLQMLRHYICGLFCAKNSGMKYSRDPNTFSRRPTGYSLHVLASQAGERPFRIVSFRLCLPVSHKINTHPGLNLQLYYCGMFTSEKFWRPARMQRLGELFL
jgi:hypothetical protein